MIPILCGLFLLLLLSPMTPMKAGNRVSKRPERKKISLCRQQKTVWKVNCFICLSTPLSNSALVVWRRKKIICMYVYICVYVYISYNNSTSQWLSELLSHHHTYLPYINKLKWCCQNNPRRKNMLYIFLK